MNINVHPLLVHFPIAFFVTYSIFEFIPFKSLKKQPYWFYTKAIILFLGIASAIPTIIAGQLIEQAFTDTALVSLHSKINEVSSALFGILALCYAVSWTEKSDKVKIPHSLRKIWNRAVTIEHSILDTPLVFILALAAFVLILIGGALGGIIVYGPNLDPFTQFIYFLFFHK